LEFIKTSLTVLRAAFAQRLRVGEVRAPQKRLRF